MPEYLVATQPPPSLVREPSTIKFVAELDMHQLSDWKLFLKLVQ